MKKSTSILIIALFTLALSANAQFLKFGLKGGITSSSVKIDQTTFTSGADNFIAKQGDAKNGYQFGLFARVKVLAIYVQPELLFSHSQGEVTIVDVNDASKIYNEVQKFNKIDIPIMVGWKIGPARIGLGPVASIMLSEKDGLKDRLSNLSGESAKTTFNKATWGYQVGVGLDILGKIALDVKYEGNLSKLGSSIKLGDRSYTLDQRNPQWIFSVGVFF